MGQNDRAAPTVVSRHDLVHSVCHPATKDDLALLIQVVRVSQRNRFQVFGAHHFYSFLVRVSDISLAHVNVVPIFEPWFVRVWSELEKDYRQIRNAEILTDSAEERVHPLRVGNDVVAVSTI